MDWGKEVSGLVAKLCYAFTEGRKELTIENCHLTRCVLCRDFIREKQGQFEAVGCGNPNTPHGGQTTQNEAQKAKFEKFACPYGRPIEEA